MARFIGKLGLDEQNGKTSRDTPGNEVLVDDVVASSCCMLPNIEEEIETIKLRNNSDSLHIVLDAMCLDMLTGGIFVFFYIYFLLSLENVVTCFLDEVQRLIETVSLVSSS